MEVKGRIFKIGYTSQMDLNLVCFNQPAEEEEETVI